MTATRDIGYNEEIFDEKAKKLLGKTPRTSKLQKYKGPLFVDTVENFMLLSAVSSHQTDHILHQINMDAGLFCQGNFALLIFMYPCSS